MSHANATLTPRGRLQLARCVVEDRWSPRRVAERFQVSATTAARWAARYREQGPDGMADPSSRPHQSPGRTRTRTERRIISLRMNRSWWPARIGYRLGVLPRPCTGCFPATLWHGSPGRTGPPAGSSAATSVPPR